MIGILAPYAAKRPWHRRWHRPVAETAGVLTMACGITIARGGRNRVEARGSYRPRRWCSGCNAKLGQRPPHLSRAERAKLAPVSGQRELFR